MVNKLCVRVDRGRVCFDVDGDGYYVCYSPERGHSGWACHSFQWLGRRLIEFTYVVLASSY